ncbi:MAG: ATP-binding protein [Pseudomonadota bacterium]
MSDRFQTDAHWAVANARIRLSARAAFLASNPNQDTSEAETSFNGKLPLPMPPQSGMRKRLLAQFGLSDAEAAMLDLAVAVRFDPALEASVAELQGKPWRPMPTEALARRLYNLPDGEICRPTSVLRRWSLLQSVLEPSGAACSYAADPRIVDFYAGKASLSEEMVGRVRPAVPSSIVPQWDVEQWLSDIQHLQSSEQAVRLVILGNEGTGRSLAAETVLQTMKRDGLHVSAAPVWEVQRFAFLANMIPIWSSAPTHWDSPGGYLPLQIVLSNTVPKPIEGIHDLIVSVPALTPALRNKYWTALTGLSTLPTQCVSYSAYEVSRQAKRLRKDGSFIEETGRSAHDLSQMGVLRRANVSWEDMVLGSRVTEQLRDFASEAELRQNVLGRADVHRLFARDAAPTALFSGPPGVGKTMAAECLAGILNLPLLVIDVSRIVSKYIGETAKNLSRVFEKAERYGCILFFDEADAFFSKRTEGNDSLDRHTNADTNHLLQLIEAYEGPVILSTNKRANIDEAFFRRMRHSIEFRKPDSAQRLVLWKQFSKILFGTENVSGLELCAERFDFSPAQIKSAVLTVHFSLLRRGNGNQSPLDEMVFLKAAAREMQKEGRSMPNDLNAILVRNAEEMSRVA